MISEMIARLGARVFDSKESLLLASEAFKSWVLGFRVRGCRGFRGLGF